MAEDYVELIAELIETRGEARPVEIAERLGYTRSLDPKAADRQDRIVGTLVRLARPMGS